MRFFAVQSRRCRCALYATKVLNFADAAAQFVRPRCSISGDVFRINFESISPDQCAVKFHAKGEMKKNISVLHLEERYEHTKNIVRDILKNKQQFCPELLHALPQEMQDKILRSLFDTPDESEKYHELHVKLRKDVAHYYDENF